jgi:uncharacterized protein YndB with AHSA1/START domain
MPKPLEITTPSDLEVVVRRELDAGADLAFRCFTEPELIKRWYGLPDWEMTVCEYDGRVGGKWRFVSKAPSGFEMGSSGVIQEFVRPKRIANTETFDQDWTGGETLVTTVFHDQGERTSVTMVVKYASKDAREGALATPMAEGMEIGFKRLDELLAEMTAAQR